MSDLMKVNASVYSRKGLEQEQNCDDFYMNGKFSSEHHIDNMEASIDSRAGEFFFAIADHMEFFDDEQKVNFSILRELGKFHEKITVQDGNIDYKTRELTTRVTETAKYVLSFHEMNDMPKEALERQMGFAGLLITDGSAVVATYGTCHVFYWHNGVVKHLTAGFPKSREVADPVILPDDDAEEADEKYQDDGYEINVSKTEPVELAEGDKFLLISDGVYNSLGEEYIEDLLSMRSDSTYIAYRTVTEAMGRECSDDMTAMVVTVDKIKSASNAAPVKKPTVKPKTGAELKNVPPPSYKYKKKNIRKYENVIYYAAVFMTAVLLILILFFVIKNIMKNLSNPGDVVIDPTPIATLSPTPTPEVTPEPEITPEPTITKAPVQVTEHIVQKGDTLSSIARKYYGDNYTYVEKLGKYNNIPAPYDTIILGQRIKIPPLEELLKVE